MSTKTTKTTKTKTNTKKTSRVQSNLLQQNCFIRDVSRSVDLCSSSDVDSYSSLDEVVVSNGITLRLSSHSYPYTVESVNSFVSSSDYRLDPVAAINQSRPRVNLGDITSLQELNSLSDDAIRALYSSLSEKISLLNSSHKTQETQEASSLSSVSSTVNQNPPGGSSNV